MLYVYFLYLQNIINRLSLIDFQFAIAQIVSATNTSYYRFGGVHACHNPNDKR